MASSHMSGPLSEAETAQAARLRVCLDDSGMTTHQLWVEALYLGGMLTPEQVGDCVAGRRAVSGGEYAVLAHALFQVLNSIPTGLTPPGLRLTASRVPRPRASR